MSTVGGKSNKSTENLLIVNNTLPLLVGSNTKLPRTLSTSALRIKRSTFWDKLLVNHEDEIRNV